MRVLAVTNMYPSPQSPTAGGFIQTQVEELRRLGQPVDVLYVDRLREGRRAYFTLAPRLKKAIADHGSSLVHVMYGGLMADRVTRHVTARPVVVTYHGDDLQGTRGSGAAQRIMSDFGVWASKRAARRASGVVVVASRLERFLPREVDPAWVRVIPCGIDLERFRPMDRPASRAHLGWQPDRFHILFVTNNDAPVKRPALAHAAVEELNRAGVDSQLQVLRGVPAAEVPLWLNAADVLLLTSFSEGSPTIVKEALACDRPVVSVDVGDVASQIEGLAGAHIAEANPQALAAALRVVAQGPRVVAGRDRIREQSSENTARRLKEFYDQVLMRWRCGYRPARVEGAHPTPEVPAASSESALCAE